MKIPFLFSVQSELPVRIYSFKLNEEKLKEFNSGKFARTNYKRLYTLNIDKGPGRTFHQLATPSFRQLLWSIPVLWNAKEGDPYDRHNHPVVMQSFDIPKKEKQKHGEKSNSSVSA